MHIYNIITRVIDSFRQNTDAVTAVEYGLIAAVISLVIVLAFGNVTDGMRVLFSTISNRLSDS